MQPAPSQLDSSSYHPSLSSRLIIASMTATLFRRVLCASLAVTAVSAFPTALEERQSSNASSLASCPGYKASNIQTTSTSLSADLTLAGTACNAYSSDISDLTLTVEYQTGTLRLHTPSYCSNSWRRHPPPCQDPGRCQSSLPSAFLRLYSPKLQRDLHR